MMRAVLSIRTIRAAAAGASLALAAPACSPPASTLMVRDPGPLRGPVPERATILFVADVRDALGSSYLWTVFDENKRFMGELTGLSAFEATVAPGHHKFGAGPYHSGFKFCVPFGGEFAAGKYYVAWLRMSNDSGQWRTLWIFPHPGSKVVRAEDVVGSAPLFEPDVAAGQAYLDTVGDVWGGCINGAPTPNIDPQVGQFGQGNGEIPDNPPDFGFDAIPR